jgi:5-methylcytosine-specific restriction endonuclease McrA
MQERVLLLDKNYIAISIVSWKKAIKLTVKGKAEAVHNSGDEISTTKGKYSIPSVIRLLTPIPWRAHIVSVRFTRRNVIIRDDANCQYCGQKVSKNAVTIDHVVPRSRGGKTDFNNCVVSCTRCNGIKANKTPLEADMKLLSRPRQPTFYTLYRNYINSSPKEWRVYIMGREHED